MLYAKDMPTYLWAEAVNSAVYLLNRTPPQALNTTPYELWTGKKPTLDHVRTFGSIAYMHVPQEKRTKLEKKSKKMILVGYDGNSTNYRLFDIETKKIKISRNVLFNENEIPQSRRNTIEINIRESDLDTEDQQEIPGIAVPSQNE